MQKGTVMEIIKVKFEDSIKTNKVMCDRKPRTKKKRIVKKWIKKYGYKVPITNECLIYSMDEGIVHVLAHPLVREKMVYMNGINDGSQPIFVFLE